jgi:hypothetical protein
MVPPGQGKQSGYIGWRLSGNRRHGREAKDNQELVTWLEHNVPGTAGHRAVEHGAVRVDDTDVPGRNEVSTSISMTAVNLGGAAQGGLGEVVRLGLGLCRLLLLL